MKARRKVEKVYGRQGNVHFRGNYVEAVASDTLTRRCTRMYNGYVTGGLVSHSDVPTGKSDRTLRALRRKYMILSVA